MALYVVFIHLVGRASIDLSRSQCLYCKNENAWQPIMWCVCYQGMHVRQNQANKVTSNML
jgi:hypothetical protein